MIEEKWQQKDNNVQDNPEYDFKHSLCNTNRGEAKSTETKIILFNILIGQFLALLGVGNASISKIIEKDYKFVTPLLLTSSYYLLLGLFWLIFSRKITVPKWSYIFITIFDSQANFLNVYAFSVIQFNFPFIINVSCVFWTCIFTWIFIRRYTYRKWHILGVSVALLGVALTLYGSIILLCDPMHEILSNLKGLIFCISASICYSITSILQEIFFKSGEDIYNYFPWMGIIGTIITFSESFIFNEVFKIGEVYQFNLAVGLLWGGFAVTLVFFASVSPFFIKRCSASMFNISLVSQIFWSYLVEVIFNEANPRGYLYYFGFAVIIIGIFVFNLYQVKERHIQPPDPISPIIANTALCALIPKGSFTSECSAFSANDRRTLYCKNKAASTVSRYIAIDQV